MADTVLELQDRIRALESELAELRRREEWIPVATPCVDPWHENPERDRCPTCGIKDPWEASPRPEPEHHDDGKSGASER